MVPRFPRIKVKDNPIKPAFPSEELMISLIDLSEIKLGSFSFL
jgi:hypothetical protein